MQTAICQRLGPKDVEAVMRLERLCFHTRWTREQFLLGLERKAFRIYGIWRMRTLVAYAAFSVIAGEMELLNIATHPLHRRKGLGRQLLGFVLETCRQKKVLEAFLEVRRSNRPAIDLYEKFGFMQVGVRKHYYPDNNEDALLYRLDFTAPAVGADHQEPGPNRP
jgi:[ribosomal protein S18]-alanine N-acetyltransferase